MRASAGKEERLCDTIKVGDYITTARYRERIRVIKCYRGAWSLKPMLECISSTWNVEISIYVEDVINHYPRGF
jgi:hypothetical protein